MSSDSLFKPCAKCQTPINIDSKRCSVCGARNSNVSLGRYFLVGLALIAIVGMLSNTSSEVESTKIANMPSTQSGISESKMLGHVARIGQDQKDFAHLFEQFALKYNSAKNELQKSNLREQRKEELATMDFALKFVENWTGTIASLSTNNDGEAILIVRISPNLTVGTWNNALSDISDGTLIPRNTPLYSKLSDMELGDTIRFSGQFIRSSIDTIYEKSLTIDGSMKNPELLFKFSDVSKLN